MAVGLWLCKHGGRIYVLKTGTFSGVLMGTLTGSLTLGLEKVPLSQTYRSPLCGERVMLLKALG